MTAPDPTEIPASRDSDSSQDKPSVRYGSKSSISVAWLSDHASSRHMIVFREAWEPLAARAEWRKWQTDHLVPLDGVLVLTVRDDLDTRKFLKTARGVSAHVPFNEIVDAEAAARLEGYFRDLIRDIYVKWADTRSLPHPPPLTR